MAANPAAKPNPAIVAEESEKCFALKLKGHSVRSIAAQLGMSKSLVQARLQAAYDDLVQPKAEEMRRVEIERYEKWLSDLEAKTDELRDSESGISEDQLVKLTATKLRVSERLASIAGLNAPVEVTARGDLRVTVAGVDLEALK